MLDLKYLRENQDDIRRSIERRGMHTDINRWLKLDARRSDLIPLVEQLRSQLKVKGQPTAEELATLQEAKTKLTTHEEELKYIEDEWRALLEEIPNAIADDTPDGGEEANRVERQGGAPREFEFTPLDHLALSDKLGLVDFEAGARVAGSRFYFLGDRAVRLWDAIEALAKQVVRRHGFELRAVPHLVNSRVAAGTGFLPRGEESQIYTVVGEDLSLIATAELPLTGLYMDQIMDLEQPVKLAASSPCYRLEAGTYGKFSKGLYRVHQFQKLEMYVFCRPVESEDLLQKIVAIEEELCTLLEIPYRVVRIAAGDLSGPANKKYDIEYWSPTDKIYRELTSCSDCTDYQARRLNIRARQADGSLFHPHTLNGTAVTSSRSLVAVLENHQTADGNIKLPAALATLYGGELL